MTYAACLAEAKRLKSFMAKWGVACSIELLGGRGSDPWALPKKYHRMHHHTASWYKPGGNMTPVLGLVKKGRSDLVGPLANGYGGFDLVYRIITMGLANHSGLGGPITIDGVYVPKDSGRGPTWGTEWEGGYQDWEAIPGMLEFMGRADCALAEYTGRPLTSQMEHSTWTDRKIDRRNFTRARGIALTQTWFKQQAPVPLPPKEDDMSFAIVKPKDVASGPVYLTDGNTRLWLNGWPAVAEIVWCYTVAGLEIKTGPGGYKDPIVWPAWMVSNLIPKRPGIDDKHLAWDSDGDGYGDRDQLPEVKAIMAELDAASK